MNPIQRLEVWLRKYLPDAKTEMDPSGTPTGSWYLDVRFGSASAVVEWRPVGGFGLTGNRKGAYGEKADETAADIDAAIGRLLPILLLGARTGPPKPVRLAELRRKRGLSQTDVADKLRRKQAAVSKVEARGFDVKVSTLMTQLRAMGGNPSIRVAFDDDSEYELQLRRS